MKNKLITIKLTGNDLFYYWLRGIKAKLGGVLLEKDIKELKKELRKVVKLLD